MIPILTPPRLGSAITFGNTDRVWRGIDLVSGWE
jgi:hypothetical protein